MGVGGLVAALTEVVGPQHVLTDPADLAGRTQDWTGRFKGFALAAVAPADTVEVAGVLACCRDSGVGVVPQGGNTGLVGGGVPHGGVVLDLRRLTAIRVDADLAQATAGAGLTIAGLQAEAAARGLRYAVDLASRSAATVGGTVATNAGGLRAGQLGDTRAQIVGLEVVLAGGTVLSRLDGLLRDNTGYWLPGILCGSEGTLAVVTAARLRLLSVPMGHAVALLAFADVEDAVAAAMALRRERACEAIELMLPSGIALVCERMDLRPPFPGKFGAAILTEFTAADDPAAAEAALEHGVGRLGGVLAAAVAMDPPDRRRLWAYRELHTEAISRVGSPHKLDVVLPLTGLAAFADDVHRTLRDRWPHTQLWLFGHVGDGNLHVNITGAAPDDDDLDAAVLTLVAQAGGSISAEHGIGRAKRRWLSLVRTQAEVDLWRAVKAAFDPTGLLNPGVLIPEPA
ncbi:MAG TPA: FAD-binding oxidoreductase [Sporichthyaceae bacterium]|jgi:FAD/FMN-containing dehydrogenase|nr:FAD-binding oxidoreductase [Sporichthyaceae bacterium]